LSAPTEEDKRLARKKRDEKKNHPPNLSRRYLVVDPIVLRVVKNIS
jgi:hypothetical protein